MAKVTLRPHVSERLKAAAHKLGMTFEEALNTAAQWYSNMVLDGNPAMQNRSKLDELLNTSSLSAIAKRRVRAQRQAEIRDEEQDKRFHKRYSRPYTPIW